MDWELIPILRYTLEFGECRRLPIMDLQTPSTRALTNFLNQLGQIGLKWGFNSNKLLVTILKCSFLLESWLNNTYNYIHSFKSKLIHKKYQSFHVNFVRKILMNNTYNYIYIQKQIHS